MTKSQNKMRLEIPAQSINEGFARSTVAAFAAQLDPTLEEIGDIKTAVSEAVTNCVVHAYSKTAGQSGTIVIDAELFADRITIRISDNGRGIKDIERAMQPFETTATEKDERSGMGFTVMQSFMDSLNVISNPKGGTTVQMKKFFQRKKPNAINEAQKTI